MTDSEKLDLLLEKVQILERNIRLIDQSLRKVELLLENNSNHEIRMVVEGYQDVMRRLDETVCLKYEREYFNLRLTALEKICA